MVGGRVDLDVLMKTRNKCPFQNTNVMCPMKALKAAIGRYSRYTGSSPILRRERLNQRANPTLRALSS